MVYNVIFLIKICIFAVSCAKTVVMDNMKILVCCHKKDVCKQSEVYMPIHVGRALTSEDLGCVGDDTGDNISHKNPSYCELTGMYWAWKNLKNIDFVGLCHYRRYFDFNHYGKGVFPLTTMKTSSFNEVNIDIDESTINFLKNDGVVVAKANHLTTSSYYQYCEWHYGKDIRKLLDVIKKTQPSKYVSAFYKTIFHSNVFHPYNMFVMNWNQFDKYCNWIFPILEMMEKEIDTSNYTQYQKRLYGYLAERLLNIYIEAEQMKIREVPVILFSDEPDLNNNSKIKFLMKNFLRDISFSILKHAM
jgi:hypothetical protein